MVPLRALSVLLALAGASRLAAQGAIDPNVAPRAAALEREGERQMAIDLLRHYLATAPDDGRAWLQLGRFYLVDARDWHVHGHRGDPDGLLYLDFAATAFDQAVRLSVDSGVVLRGVSEVDRALDPQRGPGPVRTTAGGDLTVPGLLVDHGISGVGQVDGVLGVGQDPHGLGHADQLGGVVAEDAQLGGLDLERVAER